MSVNVGLWKVLASSVLATSGLVAAGVVAVPALVPAASSPAPVAAAPTARPSVSTAPAGWTSAADQYAATRAERALRTMAEEMVAGSPWSELEWLSGGTHAARPTLAPAGEPTVKHQRDVDRKAEVVNTAVAKSHQSAPERTLAASTADTETGSTAGSSSPPVDGNGGLGNESGTGSSTGAGSGSNSGSGNGQTTTPATTSPTTETTPTPPPASTPEPPTSDTAIRLVQANIKTSMDNGRWFADYARVKALKPDFITLNEASTRTDAALTAGGYGIHRAQADSSTRETPVLWRLDTWTETASGTRYLTTRKVKWGVRAVNWVTVKNLHTGQVVSIISAHPAPTIPVTRGLLPEFMQGLAALTRELADKGPVFIGGDLNVHYQSDPYPRAAFASAGLQPTFDSLGRMPTGDHGAIIDYLLFQPHRGVAAIRQGKVEQNSDHHTIWADFSLPR